MDKAAVLALCALVFFRRCCWSESDPYDIEEDAYLEPYSTQHVFDDDELGNFEDVAGDAGAGSSGGGSNFWGGVDIAAEAARFGERLRTVANEELGIAAFQAAYDGRSYTNDVSLADKAGQMARRLQLKLQAYEEALAANRKLVEDLLAQQKKLGLAAFVTTDRVAAAAVDCCALNSTLLREDPRYSVPVASQMLCDLQVPSSAWDVSIPRVDLTEAFKNNSKRLPALKWQYYISLKSNVHCEYPAHAFPLHRDGFSCQSLVYHRHRDSLLATLRGPRKTMVIVIDNGCSLSDNQMSSAVAVADLLIESLTDADRVAVLSVANETAHLSTPQHCVPPGHVAANGAARAEKQPQSRGSAGQPGMAAENYFLHPTTDIKQHLRKVVRTVTQAVAMTNHTLAFVTAFGVLQTLFADQSLVKDDDDVSIAYISRGLMSTLSDARQVLSAIKAENTRLRSRVRIDVYALIDSGKPLIYEGIFLRDIATQNASRFDLGKEAAVPKPPRGRLVNVTSSGDLRAVVSSLLPPTSARVPLRPSVQQDGTASAGRPTSTPYYSALHLDAVDRGPVVTLMLPCLDEQSTSAFGFVGMDLRQADLAEDVLHFESSGEQLYAFIVSTSGQTMAHPMLARSGGVSWQPGFVNTDVRLLETEPGFAELFSAISSTPNGTATLNARGCQNKSSLAFCKPAIASGAYGVGRSKDHVTSYIWQRVSEQSAFVVVLKQVVQAALLPLTPQSRKLVSTADTAMSRPEAVVYHRLDLLPTENTCLYFGQLATFDASTVYLSPKAFRNSHDYLHKAETRSSVQNYVAYLRDASGLISNPGIKENVRQDVAMTAMLHKYWLERGRLSKLNAYIARRYVATARGVARTYPGVALSKAFDPTSASWYLRALATPGRLTLGAPRPPPRGDPSNGRSTADFGGSGTGLLASISQTVYEGSGLASHTEGDLVAAVVGLDVGALLLYKWLAEAMPRACGDIAGTGSSRCFLVDDSGYVVAHPRLTKAAAGGSSPVEQNHITYMEPLLAADLIAHKDFATKKLCNNMADRTMQRYYVFNTSMVGVKQNIKIGDACVRYQITTVPWTNAFLIIVNDTCSPTMPAFCPCSTTDRLCLNCDRAEQSECECPCECHARFGHPYGPCSGRATEAAATGESRGESGNATASAAMRPLGGGTLSAAVATVEEDRGLSCWPVDGDGWDGVSLAPPASAARSLPSCRAMPDCGNRTSAEACLGVLGCEWCYEQGGAAAAADPAERGAPLSKPYCAQRRHCLGGIFRLESVNEDQELLSAADVASIGDSQRNLGASAAAPVGPVAGAVMGTFLLVALGVYCYRHYTSRRDSQAECQRSGAALQELCIPLAASAPEGRDQQHPSAGGSAAPAAEAAAVQGHVNLLLLIDQVANVSPYRMNANYRRPHYAAAATTTESSDRGYSSLTQADDADDGAASAHAASLAHAATANDAGTGGKLGGGSADFDLSPTGSVASLSGCVAATCRSRGGCVATAGCRCSAMLESAPLLPPLTSSSAAAAAPGAGGRRRRDTRGGSGGRLKQQQREKSGGSSSSHRGAWRDGGKPSSRAGRQSVGHYALLAAADRAEAVATDSHVRQTALPDVALVRPYRLGYSPSASGLGSTGEVASSTIQETDVG